MMGYDIHVYVERRITRSDGSQVWISADRWKENEFFYEYPDSEIRFTREPVYFGRNYLLFALLAGVRNYGGIEPFSRPKGLPEDLSTMIRERYERCRNDFHSATWYTLDELESLNWDRPIPTEGYTIKEYAKRYEETGELPGAWCEGTTNQSMVKIVMTKPAREWCESFIDSFPKIRELGKRFDWDDKPVDPDSVRLVMWFDN
jgi:hypothetical protein